jgi:single-strand DNA-binding protein
MLNKYLAIGNLTNSPQLKELSGGKSVCVFSLAVNLGKNDKNPLFIDVQTWDNVAKNCTKYLEKGRKVFVEGRIMLNSWTAKDGSKRSKIYCKADIVTFMSSANPKAESKEQTATEPASKDLTEEDEELQSIPF